MLAETGLVLPKPRYDYIINEESARRAMGELDKHNVLGMDTEATGLDPYSSKISLVQFATPNKSFVFDIRYDTPHSSLHPDVIKPLITSNKLKILQNATYDMEMIKANWGYYIENIFDTMLVEQLLNLGIPNRSNLAHLVKKYLGITMDKQPRDTFSNYEQKFKPYQIEYAANDALVLHDIRNCQLPQIKDHGFEDVCRLEFEFTKPLCEMELNGMKLDTDKWRAIMSDAAVEMEKAAARVSALLEPVEDQTTLFGVSVIDVNSPQQLLAAFEKYGLPVENTSEAELTKFKGMPLVDAVLDYRRYAKLISTYAEPLIEKINQKTGRLHTEFKQMVATGRMSSSRPNLQNIPKKQMYRSCFVAEEGSVLITSDQSSAELRILGNLSEDPSFIRCFREGIDLHTKTAADTFGIPMDKVTTDQRNVAKTLNFGLCTTEDTEVFTDVGIKKIKEAEIGEHAAHDIGANKIIDKKFMGTKKVFELKTQYGYSIQLTSDHLMKVIDEHGNYTDKKLSEVDIDKDYVCIKSGSNLFSDGLYKFEKFEVEQNTSYKHFELPEYLDEKWACFLGLFVAEGHLHKNRRGKYNAINIGISDKIEEFVFILDKLLLRIFNNRYKKKKVNHGFTFSINSTLIACWIKSLFDVGFKNKTDVIDVPKCIKLSPKHIQIAFLRGLFEGDGSIYKKCNSYGIKYSSKSYKLVKDVQLMLLNNGILSAIYSKFDKRYPKENYYDLIIVGHKNRQLFMKNVGFLTDYKNSRSVSTIEHHKSCFTLPYQKERLINVLSCLKKLPNRTNSTLNEIHYIYNNINRINSGFMGVGDFYLESFSKYDSFFKFIYDNNIIPLPIKSIKYVGTKKVYDLSIDHHQYFLANGFVVHNCYGLSKFGLAQRLKISEKEAGKIIDSYFSKYTGVKKYLESVAKESIYKRYSTSISGRKRFYRLPKYSDPNFEKVKRSIERQSKNMGIQSSDADTIKQSMVYLVNRIEKGGYDARLVLTVHDEIVVEVKKEQKYEVAKVVKDAVIDGFGYYFNLISMETEALIGPCWLKDSCGCGGTEMVSVPTDDKYKTKIVCKKCGATI